MNFANITKNRFQDYSSNLVIIGNKNLNHNHFNNNFNKRIIFFKVLLWLISRNIIYHQIYRLIQTKLFTVFYYKYLIRNK